MRQWKITAAWLMLMTIACLVGCKPTEQNYRDAYEKTMAGRAASEAEDSTIYTNIRRQMRERQMVVDGDTVPVKSQFVSITEDGGGALEDIRRFCVVAGQFKQRFNAMMMRERMAGGQYPSTFVVETSEPYYFVVAESYDSIAPAMEMVEALQSDADLKIKAPLPFILQPSQIR